MLRVSIFIFFAYLLQVSPLRAAELSLAVASNFTGPMKELATEFEKQSGHQLQIAYGSSGKFFAQIVNGAPFQVFLSADQEKPIQLELKSLAVPGSRFTYAVGSLVLWSSRDNYLEDGPARLLEGNFHRLALANPRLAPYGRAAEQALQKLGMAEQSRSRWVVGENIAQAFQFAYSGNADLGPIAASQLQTPATDSQGSGWLVPANLHDPILQDAVLLERGETEPAARQFLAFLRSAEAAAIIRSHGYQRQRDNM